MAYCIDRYSGTFAIVLNYVMQNFFAEREQDLGFELHRRRSRRNPAIIITDLDFADDLAIIKEEIHQGQEVLLGLEIKADKIGLHCNAKNK